MKNYNCKSNKLFEITLEEVSELNKSLTPYFKINYKTNLILVQNDLGKDITEFTLRFLPKKYKINKFDKAQLLIFRIKDGSYFAKRFHNNNQYLKLVI